MKKEERRADADSAESASPKVETILSKGVEYVNLSAEDFYKVVGWLPRGLEADKVVFFPDACPSQAPLPTGVAVHIPAGVAWHKYALSDCGRGMLLVDYDLDFFEDFEEKAWDEVGRLLKKNNGQLGDLGGGNHFLDAIVERGTEKTSFLIHTGSRTESAASLEGLVDSPKKFEEEYGRVSEWAAQNRLAVAEALEKVFGRGKIVVDLVHNSFEKLSDGSVIVRKGVVKVASGGTTILPSSMSGDVSLMQVNENADLVLNSISHGTGRTMSRSEAKKASESLDFDKLRNAIYIPEYIQNVSLRTEGPHCYRNLDECLRLLEPIASEIKRYSVVAYLGGL